MPCIYMRLNFKLISLFLLWSSCLFATDDPIVEVQHMHFPKAEYIGENTVRIPFKLIGHLMVIEAEVYNKKGNFIVDTGSENLLLNKVHFTKHRGRAARSGYAGVNGEVDQVRIRWLKKILLNDFSIENIKANSVNLSHIEKSKKMQLYGIIGYKVLKDYEVFIDFYLKQITLSKVDKKGNKIDQLPYLEKITDSLNFILKRHTIILKSYVNGSKLNFGLDTGAEINMLHTGVSKKVLEKFTVDKRILMVGADQRKIEVLAGKLNDVRFSGRIYNKSMRTILTNLRDANVAYGTRLDGILGYEFMVKRRIILNYKRKRLYFVEIPIEN